MAAMIEVAAEGGAVALKSPYHPDLPSMARRIGGRWDRQAWRFDSRDEERVRDLARDIYGTDGADGARLVDVEIIIHDEIVSQRAAIYFAGREIARAFGRDSGCRLGEGVLHLEGESPQSGGSAKNWTTVLRPGRYELRDVPAPALPPSDAESISWTVVRDHGSLGS